MRGPGGGVACLARPEGSDLAAPEARDPACRGCPGEGAREAGRNLIPFRYVRRLGRTGPPCTARMFAARQEVEPPALGSPVTPRVPGLLDHGLSALLPRDGCS